MFYNDPWTRETLMRFRERHQEPTSTDIEYATRINDFKSIAGDRRSGIRSLPVRLGARGAAWVACGVMLAPQLAVVALLAAWGRPLHAAGVALLVAAQLPLMRRFLAAPRERALWYSGVGVPAFVAGMMVAAFAVRALGTSAGTPQ